MEGNIYQLSYTVEEETPARRDWEPAEFILNADVHVLEHKLAAYVGTEHCVAVSDGASGIALALRVAGAAEGDTVLCSALGCATPVQGILLARARPVFVDVNPNTYTIDPYCVEYALKKMTRAGGRFPKCLIATDLFGAPCNHIALQELCDRHGMALIEDLTGALGATLDGRQAGSFGRFAVTSFAPQDPLEELGGGAVFCHRAEDAKAMEKLRNACKQQFIGELATSLPFMGAADAALADARLESFDHLLARRREVAQRYVKTLRGHSLRPQQMVTGGVSSYSRFAITLPRSEDRVALIERMQAHQIPCAAPASCRETAYNAWNKVMLVNTVAISGRLLELPINPYITTHLIDKINELLISSQASVVNGAGQR